MFSVLPVTLSLNGFVVPLLNTNSTQGLVPNLIALLKVIFTTVFNAALTALLAGLEPVTTGGV